MSFKCLPVALWLQLLCAGSWAGPVFEKDIRPLLKAHCFHCHGEGGKKEGGVDLRLRRFMLHQTEEGRVMEPGNPAGSHLLQLVRSGEMPKGEKKLSPAEVALLEQWIAQGAPVLRDEPESIPAVYITEEERHFWSFRPIVKPPVPEGEANPIDAFIAGPLRAAGLDFLPEAEGATLVRRLSFDLTGLPPAADCFGGSVKEAAERLLSARAGGAYEGAATAAYLALVDALLEVPQYGERWGRHWLDVAGYADSNGYEEDAPRLHAWHYRDYVVQAHGADLPWDRFIQEQLAGDEMVGTRHAEVSQVIHEAGAAAKLAATGFLRMGPDATGGEVADAGLARNQVMAETLKTVTTALLGLTVGCAQCHDHRYEPISQQDYFRLRAVFEPVYDWKNWRPPGERLYSLYTEAERQQASGIEAEAQKIDAERVAFAAGRLREIFAERLAKVPPDEQEAVRAARETEVGQRSAVQVALLKKYVEANVGTDEGLLLLFDVPSNNKRTAMQAQAAALRATKPKESFLMAATEPEGALPETFLHHRGDHEQPREKMLPGPLEVLAPGAGAVFSSPVAGLRSSGRRLAFSQWLTSGQHPLTARVLVNRFWMHHFGRGLVRTPGDFGALGEAPTHGALLDWLAADFMEHGWQLKRLHRMILSSRTWRQRSDPQRTAERERLYVGANLQRLDAESLRDAMLAATGRLNAAVGGEPVSVARDLATGRIVPGKEVINPGNGMIDKIEAVGDNAFRRSLYMESRRSRPLTVLDTFDLPLLNPNCTSRTVTTVAPQALLLMNDAFSIEQAEALAERLEREAPQDDGAKIARAWALLFGGVPENLAISRSLVFLHRQRGELEGAGKAPGAAAHKALAAWCQVLLSSNAFLYLE